MRALITGASSGIGRDISRILAGMGYDLILVARREDRLKELSEELSVDCRIIPMDVSSRENCFELYNILKNTDIDILVNNAGFGIFGDFSKTDLSDELQLISVNIEALHILTKLFLKDFIKRDRGYILNVASVAGFLSGPQMSSYYASKNYVVNLTMAIYEELRHNKSNVSISCLCPGPVKTEFNQVANVKFGMASMSSEKTSQIAVKKMFKRKLVIIPGVMNKISVFMSRFISKKLMLKITYRIQEYKK